MLKKTLLCALAFTLSSSFCFAQESLLIGPGDQLHVRVFDTPEMDQHPRVNDAGNIPLMFVGDVKVGGMTPGDAARTIEAALVDGKYMLHPHVEINVDEYGTQQISVIGEVKAAGTYDATAPMPILSILAMAGGLTSLADRHITIQRHGSNTERVTYFVSNTSQKALETSVYVYPGDTVVVPKVGIVYVIGDVARPGGYEIATNDGKLNASQAVAMAGSTNKTAVPDKARIIRRNDTGTEQIALRLDAIQKGKMSDVTLQADDILYIPFSWMKNVAVNASSIVSSTSGAAIYAAK